MSTSSRITDTITASSPNDGRVVLHTYTLLKYLFTVVPIVAGADKFTNLLTHWDAYLNPLALWFVPVSAPMFMHIAGVIEIVAGILVFAKPRLGGWVVMVWLLAIALQLLAWGQFFDVAVRDIVIALSGPLTLARLAPLISRNNSGIR